MEVLADLHYRCCHSFEKLLKAVASPVDETRGFQVSHEILESEFDKYKLWAANVGAMHHGDRYKLSLDHRLRESPFYQDRVTSFLTTLEQKVWISFDIKPSSAWF
ncbi:hypothetical protein BU25DRAFT_197151 [Macroventuria anomochaeta]|uniref:Uncharacterized protein n=1 Tax=Macroventuria anomochaeta TaxID=301207 RepID=A0ACB6SBX2_9PLEO|nr:uncharacterized protein BU25DRAFT_197151 [Macroventuria anomochaeta]KAF2631800.1 hypothetical protein BU25DRAFT_197151 [Macroventuria anomochaeta]